MMKLERFMHSLLTRSCLKISFLNCPQHKRKRSRIRKNLSCEWRYGPRRFATRAYSFSFSCCSFSCSFLFVAAPKISCKFGLARHALSAQKKAWPTTLVLDSAFSSKNSARGEWWNTSYLSAWTSYGINNAIWRSLSSASFYTANILTLTSPNSPSRRARASSGVISLPRFDDSSRL